MTLGEFKEYIKNMRDDVELKYHHCGEYHSVNTFSTSGNALILVTKNYDESDAEGIIRTMIKFNKKV